MVCKKTHTPAVMDMLQYSLSSLRIAFSLIDAGCGNGWVVRYMNNQSMCDTAIGVDDAMMALKQRFIKTMTSSTGGRKSKKNSISSLNTDSSITEASKAV